MMQTLKQFVNYCNDFYGMGGLYDMAFTKKEIAHAVDIYFGRMSDQVTWGGGDTVDRERVYEIMREIYTFEYKVEVA